MKRLLKILSASLLVFAVCCTQYSEIPFPDPDSIPVRDEPVTIHFNYKQEVTIDNKLNLRFEGVGADSRCPIDAICIWAGDGEVFLRVSTDNLSRRYTLHTTLEPREIVIDNYVIQLISLLPSVRSDRRISQEDYNIEIKVTKIDHGSVRKVQIIEMGQTGLIRNDMLSVSGVTLADDILDFTVGYSGGCREHLIELFALKEIEKSNPARVSIRLSHISNGDICLAYITGKARFDLNPLKQFLKNNYGINDRVILVVSDPSGNPINKPTIEYKF